MRERDNAPPAEGWTRLLVATLLLAVGTFLASCAAPLEPLEFDVYPRVSPGRPCPTVLGYQPTYNPHLSNTTFDFPLLVYWTTGRAQLVSVKDTLTIRGDDMQVLEERHHTPDLCDYYYAHMLDRRTGRERSTPLHHTSPHRGESQEPPREPDWSEVNTERGVVVWDRGDVVLMGGDPRREIARGRVAHPVDRVFKPYLGDDVWMFATLSDASVHIDAFSPGLAEHLVSSTLDPGECLPPVEGGPDAPPVEGLVIGEAYAPHFGLHAVGEAVVAGPWSPSRMFPLDGREWYQSGLFFAEVTREGAFAGTSLMLFRGRPSGLSWKPEVAPFSLTRLLVDASKFWLLDPSQTLLIIDWEGAPLGKDAH